MEHINDVLNNLNQSERELAVEMKKIESAQLVSAALAKLKASVDKIRTNIDCEIAVIQTQQLIDGE